MLPAGFGKFDAGEAAGRRTDRGMEYAEEDRESGGEVALIDAVTEGPDLRRMRTSAEWEDWIREDIRVKGPEAPSRRG
jgi:hypothetical protein